MILALYCQLTDKRLPAVNYSRLQIILPKAASVRSSN